MWRAAESAAIEERRRRRRRHVVGSPDFFVAIFSHPPRQSDSVGTARTIHRRTRLLTTAPRTVGIRIVLRLLTGGSIFYMKPCCFRFHIDQSTRLSNTSLMIYTKYAQCLYPHKIILCNDYRLKQIVFYCKSLEIIL